MTRDSVPDPEVPLLTAEMAQHLFDNIGTKRDYKVEALAALRAVINGRAVVVPAQRPEAQRVIDPGYCGGIVSCRQVGGTNDKPLMEAQFCQLLNGHEGPHSPPASVEVAGAVPSNAWVAREDTSDPPEWESPQMDEWQSAIVWATLQLADMLGVRDYDADAASETLEGDTRATMWNVLRAAGAVDEETGKLRTAALSAAPPPSVATGCGTSKSEPAPSGSSATGGGIVKRQPKERTFYFETYMGAGLSKHRGIVRARKELAHSEGKANLTKVRPATEADIAWVQGMGGYVP